MTSRGIDLVDWAKTMGFPGADNPDFQANVGRLLTPQTMTMMKHLMKHVRPANEVAKIRKRLLEYKLSVDDNHTASSLKKFESVAQYEAFCKKRALLAKITHCNLQVEKKQANIKNVLAKLEEEGEQHQLQKQREKDKLEKLRLLRGKTEDLEKQVVVFKQMAPLLEELKQPFHNYVNRPETLNRWEMEVQNYCSSLERGAEIPTMCDHLREALKFFSITKVNGTPCGNEDWLNTRIEDYHHKLMLEKMEISQKYHLRMKELETVKEKVISSLLSSGDASLVARLSVLEKFIENGTLEAKGKAAENAYMKTWISNNHKSFDTSLCSSYVEEMEKTAELDRMIDDIQEEIKFFVNAPVSQLETALPSTIIKMKDEVSTFCFKEVTPSAVVEKILSDLPQLIELFLKTKKVNSGTRSIQENAEFKDTASKSAIDRSFASLDVTLKDDMIDSGAIIQQVEKKVLREKSKMNKTATNLTEILSDVDEILKYITIHLACREKSIKRP